MALMAPKAMQQTTVSRMASGKGMPYQTINVREKAAPRVARAPTERSNTLQEKAKVVPMAITTVMDAARRIFSTLFKVKKNEG